MSRKLLLIILVGFVLLWGRPGLVEAASEKTVRVTKTIRLELNKSVVFRLGEPATRISIANPLIADVTLITPKQILIVSKAQMGMTNMIVWYDDDRASAYDVEVYIPSHLIEKIKESLKEHAPCAEVKPSMSARSLVLDGYVPDQETLRRVIDIAKSFVSEVTNLIRVRGMVQQAIDQSIPEKSWANVTATMTKEGVVLDGTVDSQETLIRVLRTAKTFTPNVTNQLRVQGPQQVQIEVTIAEVSRSTMKRLGLSTLFAWDEDSIGVFTPGATSSNDPDSVNYRVEGDSLSNLARGMWSTKLIDVFSATGTTSAFGSAFQLMLRSSDGLGILSVLKGQGLARTLATPTLITLHGQEAEFLVGGEIPYVTYEEITFRKFGIQLKFTPFVIGNETITLRVEPEVSSPDYSFDPPGLKSRRASTVIQLKDGQTFVLAGLLTEDISRIANKVPFLGDIPILGSLFTSKQFLKNESELVIIATPRLVRPLNACEVPPLPGANIEDDTDDAQFFLLNDKKYPSHQKGGKSLAAPLPCGATGFTR